MLESENYENKKYTFIYDDQAKFAGFNSRLVQDGLFRWGMKENIYLKRFRYDQPLHSFQLKDFITEFFNSPEVNPHIKTKCSQDRWGTLGKVSGVLMEETSHSVTSLDFFDVIYKSDIVRPNGDIRKCLDEYIDPPGFLISDELRKCLAMEASEVYPIFTQEERKEFIFHVFKSLCLGGKICQYEDNISSYLEATKLVYKDLISVRKNAKTGDLEVSSHVFKIYGFNQVSKSPLFPMDHPQNFCYLSIKGVDGKGAKVVDVFYHASDTFYQ
ncbi:hypothetical protein HDU92_009120 [Lobulomyces angularis]|nr:hypothetical protein HDU92_009120 [Lobulomyces angularis]